jgi:peptidyl-tRNA hydrolase
VEEGDEVLGLDPRVEEGGREFALLKPATYMNESGRSVGAFLRFYKIEPRRCWSCTTSWTCRPAP